jgi:Flp pilus assembly protein TadD
MRVLSKPARARTPTRLSRPRTLQLEAQDIEIMLGLLTPRATGVPSAGDTRFTQAAGAAQVMTCVRAAGAEFQRRLATGDSVAKAILALAANAWAEQELADIGAAIDERRIGGNPVQTSANADTDWIALFIHDLAVEGFRSGHIERAAALFATMLHLEKQQAEALSGLALCGVRRAQFAEALTLATECLKLPEKHPRAYCIAGFCELERGNRKAAQSLLALGARIARKRPEFAEDLRAAQRILLILHFS